MVLSKEQVAIQWGRFISIMSITWSVWPVNLQISKSATVSPKSSNFLILYYRMMLSLPAESQASCLGKYHIPVCKQGVLILFTNLMNPPHSNTSILHSLVVQATNSLLSSIPNPIMNMLSLLVARGTVSGALLAESGRILRQDWKFSRVTQPASFSEKMACLITLECV